MSAIVALATRREDPVEQAWLERATSISRQAGPDGQRTKWMGQAGLGHALLDTGRDRQGPQTLDGRTWIAADARLDARPELVTKLRSARADLSAGDDDATLLLHAYSVWGDRLLDHVIGDFAFAIWDGEAARLLCARDQIGVVPLHYIRTAGGVAVASVLGALLDHSEIPDTLDESAIADFLVFGWFTDASASAFLRVRQLPAAHRLVWSAGVTTIERYWTAPESPPLLRPRTIEAGAAQLLAQLDAAVADRLTTKVVVTHLSGGMDSTSVAASAEGTLRDRGGQLRGFTGTLGSQSGDQEGAFAKRVADHLQIPLDIADASTYPSLDPFASPIVPTPEPIAYAFTAFEREYAAVPARYSPVALSGHAGDAVFGSAPWYWLERLARGNPSAVLRGFAEVARLTGERPHPRLRATWHSVRANLATPVPALPPWLDPDFLMRSGVGERWREQTDRGLIASTAQHDVRAVYTGSEWANQFRVGDPSFTGIPVRFRYPLVDLRLIAFARSLPPDPWLIDKRVLREAARARLPAEVLLRKKTPLIVRPATGLDETRAHQLAELVSRCEGLKRFIDPAVLSQELLAGAGDALGQIRRPRERALGLAHWLWHR